ncbi:MAG TPA: SGNH hydrolase domain-containing protein [Solirubrobacteraceae bacterium]|nr:SGNH hydrolase domain-containing protein [Solirubrobacteraceae bacterium]
MPPLASLLVSLALALLAAPSAIAAAEADATGETRSTTADARDAAGPLDLTEVTLGQRDVRMTLRVVSAGGWDSRDLSAAAARELCITLVDGQTAVARSRICVTRRSGRTALDLTPLDTRGAALAPRVLAAEVSRPDPTVLEATFLPAAAGLAIGPFGWYADSAWTDPTTCPATCRDRAPETGAVTAGVVLLAVAPCFGAASRDPKRGCDNPALRDRVDPPPARAKVVSGSFCDSVQHARLITACGFGAMPQEAERTFALIGDSHAANMKSALTVLTLAKRWRGVSILRAGCPLTRGSPILASPQRSRQCRDWNRQVLAWLAEHREVRTVFLSAHAGARVKRKSGRSAKQAAQRGYRAVIAELLRMRRRVVIIRDTPPATNELVRCVSQAMAAGRRAQTACTRPRSAAVRPDPLVAAGRSLRSSRVKLIDLTPHFCDSRRCFTVIGGALVRHDASHLTQAFAASLGPFILRALNG